MAEIQKPEGERPADSSHYAESSARENLVEHVFLGELLRGLWRKNVRDLEVLRPEVDNGVLWIFFDPDTLLLGPFLWFGGAAGEKIPPMGDRIAKHTKPNAMLEKADRPAHRVIPKNRFAKLETIETLGSQPCEGWSQSGGYAAR
jgi:hypothetical protein